MILLKISESFHKDIHIAPIEKTKKSRDKIWSFKHTNDVIIAGLCRCNARTR